MKKEVIHTLIKDFESFTKYAGARHKALNHFPDAGKKVKTVPKQAKYRFADAGKTIKTSKRQAIDHFVGITKMVNTPKQAKYRFADTRKTIKTPKYT